MITSLWEIAKSANSETTFWRKFNDAILLSNKYLCAKIAPMTPNLPTSFNIIYQENTHKAMVIMWDSVKPHNKAEICELLDEEPFNDELPLWFTESSHRVSQVHYLRHCMIAVEEAFKGTDKDIEVYGLLLSDSYFINYDDMEEIYESMGVRIKDNLSNLGNRIIPANYSDDFIMEHCLDCITKHTDKLEVPSNATYKNFPKKPTTSKLPLSDEDFDSYFENFLGDKNLFNLDDDDTSTESHKKKAKANGNSSKKCNETAIVTDRGRFSSVAELAKFLSQNNSPINISCDMELPDIEIFYPLPEPHKALDQMVGLNDIKDKITDVACLAQYNAMKKKSGTPHHTLNLHATFSGNPGTGKTTMARIWASLLHEHGQLSHGHLVMATRSSFVGTKWGMEEENLSKILQISEGGVLMIDEAYSLVSAHPSDPGRLVLPLLLNRLADESRRNISVVLAGYPAEMHNLLKTNPGITSRFANKFEFKDFSLDQLYDITRNKIAYYGYTFTPTAWARYQEVVEEAYSRKDRNHFGNARYVANILERIYLKHARRIVNSKTKSRNILRLTIDDIVDNERPTMVTTGVGFTLDR